MCHPVGMSEGLSAARIKITIKETDNYSMVSINIETGRKNQIRVHMKDNNTPILCDRKYGKKDGFRNMMLTANNIIFNHLRVQKIFYMVRYCTLNKYS